MANSLRDQLLALGLAKEKQTRVRQVVQAPVRRAISGKEPRKQEVSPLFSDLSLEAAYRLREQQTKQQAELVRERKRQLDLERRRLNEAIREIVMPHRLNDDSAELTRNFLYKGRIRKVRVTPGQLKFLNEGALGLVYLSGSYHILESEQVRAVSELSQEHVPDLSGGTSGDRADEEFPVPDDLIW